MTPGSRPSDPPRWRGTLATGLGLAFVLGAVAHGADPAAAGVTVPEPSETAVRYYWTGNGWWVVNRVWALLVPALILATGFSARLRDWASRLTGGRWYPTLGLYACAYLTLVTAIDVPLAFYQSYVRQHAYGLSNQVIEKWFSDLGINVVLSLVTALLVLWMPFQLLRRSPRRWWLYTGLAALPFFFLIMLIAPIWVDPLFTDFGRMQDTELEAKILEQAGRTGVEAERVWEAAKSVDTKRVNAYVTGFLGTQRIVLWDTLLERLDDPQVVFVMGHELGHYVLGHVYRGVLVFSLAVLGGLYLIHRSSAGILGRWADRFGFDRLSDPAALPLLFLLFNIWSMAISPVALAYSRWQEHEADRFALELTQDNQACGEAFVELQTSNLSYPYPGPIYRVLRAGHPPIGERVAFCNGYRPWESGGEQRYVERFETAE